MHMSWQASDLKEYYDTPQGRIVQRVLRHSIRHLWPQLQNMNVLGYGYTQAYLRGILPEAGSASALMPDGFGAVFWPEEQLGRVALCESALWPIETNSVDRLIMVHAPLSFENMPEFMGEAWRVLKGQGKLLMIVPNRTGIWARVDATPFGHGTPFSAQQLRVVLKNHLFVPERMQRALFLPPTQSRLLLSTTPMWEEIGQKFFPAFGGALMLEASKQLYSGTPLLVHDHAKSRRKSRIAAMVRPLSRE